MSRVIAGHRAVAEALRGRLARQINVIYISDQLKRTPDDIEQLRERAQVRLERLSPAAIDALAEGVRHQGIVAIGGPYPYCELETLLEEAADPPLLVALDEITDPHNFGAIVRSAVAFGADGVITLKRRAAPVTPVVVRASAGATEHANIAQVTNMARTLQMLAKQGLEIVGLAGESHIKLKDLGSAPYGRVLVVGSEGRGLRRLVRERCDVLTRIEIPGPIESLNASVAAGIAIYEASRQRE